MFPYAKIIDGTVVDRRVFPVAPDTGSIRITDGAPVWRPVVVENEAFDPHTQVRTGPEEIIEDARVLDRYTVTARPRADREAEKAEDIRIEAERRIEAGLTMPSDGASSLAGDTPAGVRFRCDTQSMARIHGLKDAPESVFPVQFKTAAGVTVTVTDRTQALTLFQAASAHVAATLKTSASLQDSLTGLSTKALAGFDATDDQHWT